MIKALVVMLAVSGLDPFTDFDPPRPDLDIWSAPPSTLVIDSFDIDWITFNLFLPNPLLDFVGNDLTVTHADRDWYLAEIGVPPGDSNVDRLFAVDDLIQVFLEGRYETGIAAGWAQGDWTGDERFDSRDLILALQRNGGVGVIPEPSSWIMGLGALVMFVALGMWRGWSIK